MKRRLMLLLGAATMSATSVVGVGAITATPASALGTTPDPAAAVGYVINLFGCVFNGLPVPPNVGDCLRSNLYGLLGAIGLPVNPPEEQVNNSLPSAPSLPGSNAPSLKLPASVTDVLKTLPPALQTTPVADATAPVAPISQLVPVPVLNRGLTTSAPKLPTVSQLKASLPKVPTPAEISLLNIADNAPVESSSMPVSGADLLQLVGLGAIGAAAVTAATRRKMAAAR